MVDSHTIPQSAIQACPYVILAPEHYREDNTCRCNDEQHTEMAEWGYSWDAEKGQWVA